MTLTHSGERFECRSGYENRHIPKAAGFRWDPTKKLWWTQYTDAAAKLAEYADAVAVAQLTPPAEFTGDISAPNGLAYLPYQLDGVKFAVNHPRCLIADEMGLGKEQPLSAKIPTPNGWRLMGDMRIGSVIYGADGHPTIVTGVFPQGWKETYKVKFRDGTSTECGREHLWAVRERNARSRKQPYRVKPLAELLERGIHYEGTSINKWSVPLAKPIQYPERDLPIHPYILGVLLGDGGLIPTEYLLASIGQRLNLLKGLMDTDGSSKKNRITFHSCSHRLAEDVAELTRSLGGVAIIREYERKDKPLEFQVNVKMNICPFHTSRKAAQWRPAKRNKPLKMISSVIPMGRKPHQCISIANPDGLYITDDYIVTHNTIEAIGLINTLQIRRALIVCPASLRLNWERELRKWLTEQLSIGIAIGSTWPADKDITICNYDILGRHLDHLHPSEPWPLVVFDECFVAGTCILTYDGPKAIESIRVGESVNNAIGYGRVTKTSVRQVETLVKVETTTTTVLCSEHHLFLTNFGWIPACDLSLSHYIIKQHETLLLLLPGIRGKLQETTVLRELLLGEVEDVRSFTETQKKGRTTSNCKENFQSSEESSQQQPSVGSECFQTHVAIQPHEQSSDSPESLQHVAGDGPQAAHSRRQRSRPDETREHLTGSLPASNLEPPYPHTREAQQRLPASLQSGSSLPKPEMRGGDRRLQSPSPGTQGQRSEKDHQVERTRVVGITILKQGHPDWPAPLRREVEVYNIEVRGHPSYCLADGSVVHNSHYLKSPKAARTRYALGGRYKKDGEWVTVKPIPAARVLMLTGTPILNRPEELWGTLSALDPERWRSWKHYVTRYCSAFRQEIFTKGSRRKKLVWNTSGASNLEELASILRSTCLIRRTKAEVLPELPEKRRQIIEFPANGTTGIVQAELDTWNEHQEVEELLTARATAALLADDHAGYREAVESLKEARAVAFTEMSKVRHEVALAKLPQVIEHLGNVLESTNKLVVFAHHKDIIAGIADEFDSSVTLTGATLMLKRQEAVDRFQDDPRCRLFVGNTKAAGLGITLTVASHVCFAELDWTPAIISQAEDRLHRLGQHNSVLVQHLVLEKSLDSKMAQMLVEKQEIINLTLDAPLEQAEQAPLPLPTPEELDSTPPVPREAYAEITRSLVFLAERTFTGLDGQGFNRHDADIGGKLAGLTTFTPRQAVLAKKLANKYRRQLGGR